MTTELGPRPVGVQPSVNVLSGATDITVSDRFRRLPEVKARHINRLTAARLALASTLVPFLVACGQGNTEQPTPTPIPEPTPITETFTPATATPEATPTPLPTPEKAEAKALELDGKSYIEIPMKEGLPKGDFTVEFKTKIGTFSNPEQVIVGGSLFHAFSTDEEGREIEYDLEYKLQKEPESKHWSEPKWAYGPPYKHLIHSMAFSKKDMWGTNSEFPKTIASFGSGGPLEDYPGPKWEHFVAQVRNGTLYLFLDGKLLHSSSRPTGRKETAVYPHERSRQNTITIGVYRGLEDPVGFYEGQIKDLQISNVARYNDGGFVPSSEPPVADEHTVLLMPLNGDTNDHSGNGNNGTIVGTAGFKPQ